MTSIELKNFRKERGLTQQKLTDLLFITVDAVKSWETNRRNIPKSKIALIKSIDSELSTPSMVTEPEMKYDSTGVPYYDVDVSASQIEMFETRENVISHIKVPGFEDCDFAVSVYGDSMYPKYCSGNIIGCKEIKDKSLFLYGEAYLIVTEDYRMIKRVARGENDSEIVAVSDNQEMTKAGYLKYEAFSLPKDKILKLYLVKGKIERNTL